MNTFTAQALCEGNRRWCVWWGCDGWGGQWKEGSCCLLYSRWQRLVSFSDLEICSLQGDWAPPGGVRASPEWGEVLLFSSKKVKFYFSLNALRSMLYHSVLRCLLTKGPLWYETTVPGSPHLQNKPQSGPQRGRRLLQPDISRVTNSPGRKSKPSFSSL